MSEPFPDKSAKRRQNNHAKQEWAGTACKTGQLPGALTAGRVVEEQEAVT
jgi:hypothetical protein